MMPPFSSSHGSDSLRSYSLGFGRRNASLETISLDAVSNRVSADDMELNNSPSSAVSSVCHSSLGSDEVDVLRADEVEEEEDEVMSSYVIEINSENREGTCESNGVDEAIAWAKERSQTHYSECEAEKTTHAGEEQTPPTEELVTPSEERREETTSTAEELVGDESEEPEKEEASKVIVEGRKLRPREQLKPPNRLHDFVAK